MISADPRALRGRGKRAPLKREQRRPATKSEGFGVFRSRIRRYDSPLVQRWPHADRELGTHRCLARDNTRGRLSLRLGSASKLERKKITAESIATSSTWERPIFFFFSFFLTPFISPCRCPISQRPACPRRPRTDASDNLTNRFLAVSLQHLYRTKECHQNKGVYGCLVELLSLKK